MSEGSQILLRERTHAVSLNDFDLQATTQLLYEVQLRWRSCDRDDFERGEVVFVDDGVCRALLALGETGESEHLRLASATATGGTMKTW